VLPLYRASPRMSLQYGSENDCFSSVFFFLLPFLTPSPLSPSPPGLSPWGFVPAIVFIFFLYGSPHALISEGSDVCMTAFFCAAAWPLRFPFVVLPLHYRFSQEAPSSCLRFYSLKCLIWTLLVKIETDARQVHFPNFMRFGVYSGSLFLFSALSSTPLFFFLPVHLSMGQQSATRPPVFF